MSNWLLAVLFLPALLALAKLIGAVPRMLRGARLCGLPLTSRQPIEFPTAGKVVLCMEGPRFTPASALAVSILVLFLLSVPQAVNAIDPGRAKRSLAA